MSKISIKQLCLEFLNSKDEGSDRFRRLYRIATLEGVREFNSDITGTFRTVLLSITPNHTVPFPADYLDYSMIGVVNKQGEAVPLKHNENLVQIKQAFLAANDAVVPVPKIPGPLELLNQPGYPLFFLNYYWGGNWMHLYGIGGGTGIVGEFTVDDRQKCFLVNPGFQWDSILVEYLTNGYDCDCDEYMVDVFASTAFLAWLRWKDAIDSRKKFSLSEIDYLRKEFGREKLKARVRLNPVRVKEMEDVKRRLVKLVARA